MNFYHLQKMLKTLLGKGLDPSKKVVHKSGECLGNKIAGAITKWNDDNIEKYEPVEEKLFHKKKREEILNKLREVL